jgi:hypothetical protein
MNPDEFINKQHEAETKVAMAIEQLEWALKANFKDIKVWRIFCRGLLKNLREDE